MTRMRKSTESQTSRNRLPSTRVNVSSLGNETDRRLYRVLKIIKDRCDTKESTVFDPILSASEASSRVQTLIRVEKGVFNGKYTSKPWRFIKHVNEAFNHILTSKSKRCKIHLRTLEFKETFENQMDQIMEELGYCCGHWYSQKAKSVSCTGNKRCVVPEGSAYFRYCEWTYCSTCFDNILGDVIKVETTFGHILICKQQFQRYYFEESRPERFVDCELCRLKFHEVCVLHCMFSFNHFFCDRCRDKAGIPKVPLRASRLPKTECDMFINDFLQTHQVNLDNQIIIRLLSEVEQKLDVPEKFQNVLIAPNKIEYRNCTLFTFFDTGSNSDVCFFSVFFQLFGDCCYESNRNTAYISYVDSVNFLPKNRTLIYRLVLLGLFAFLKLKGYSKIYLWSCPPSGNQDYIFYVKPEKMKMPTPERLSKWYRDLLITGMELGVITSYTGIQDSAADINGLPFMQGDLWITRLSEAINTVGKERSKDHNIIKNLNAKLTQETQPSKIIKIRQQLESLQFKNQKRFNTRLWELLTVQINGFNSEYFVIHLAKEGNVKKENLTDDMLIRSRKWLNDRHVFMDFFWGHTLEFSTERRAQYSTFVMLWKIFMENGLCVECNTLSKDGVSEALCRSCHTKYRNSLLCSKEVDDVVLLSDPQLEEEEEEVNNVVSLSNSQFEEMLSAMESAAGNNHDDLPDIDLPAQNSLDISTDSLFETMGMLSRDANSTPGPSEPFENHSDTMPQMIQNSPKRLKTQESDHSFVDHLIISTNSQGFQEHATVDLTCKNSPGSSKDSSSDSGIESIELSQAFDKAIVPSLNDEPTTSRFTDEPGASRISQEAGDFVNEDVIIIDSEDSELECAEIMQTGCNGDIIDLTKSPFLKPRKFSRDSYDLT